MPLVPPRRTKLGPLDAIDFPSGPDNPVVVCLHGYGADMQDLAFMAEMLRLPAPVRWVFPNGLRARMDGGWEAGRAWWALDESRVFSGLPEERVDAYAAARPEGLDAAAAAVRELIETLGVPWDRLLLGGFSQGAMLALEVALEAPQPPKGLFLLSGALLDEAGLRRRAPAKSGLSFFQSHGRQDPILSYQGAKRLNQALNAAGWSGELFDFDGGHELRPEGVQALQAYLAGLLSPAQERP
jgi:phospholipase/carboxylesterase